MPFPRHVKGFITRLAHVLHITPRVNPCKTALISFKSQAPVHYVSPLYLSFSIDISVIVGGFWWEGSMGVRKGLGTLRVPPLSLDNKKLDRLVQALGPAYLRVGGSEADKIFYFDTLNKTQNDLVLTYEMWDQLHAFVQRNHLDLVFTCKYGLFSQREQGEWDGQEIIKLLKYTNKQNYKIAVCELGNELNAYWAFHGFTSQPRAKNLAIDYATFAQIMQQYMPEAKIMGPGSAFWPKLGETLKPLSNISKKFLANLNFNIDIVSWHYYPFQSKRSPIRTRTATLRSLLSPKSYGYFSQYAEQLRTWRDRYQPSAAVWAGETGSAQCGGQPQLSDSFASCFWWADQLGQGAVVGQEVMIRQSLIGGDYGMINRLTLKPRPDYWVSWLWRRLMGEAVYAVSCSHKRLRVYCHQHPDKKSKTFMLINSSHYKFEIDTLHLGVIKQRFVLTAKTLTAHKVYINNKKAKFNKGAVNLNDFLLPNDNPDNQTTVGPFSINFWVIHAQ